MATGSHFVKKIKVAYWSEMAGNAIKSDFRSSKIAGGSHFVKIINKKSCVLIWNCEKCDRKWFSVIQNGRRQPFCEQNPKKKICVLIGNGEKCDRKRFLVIQNGRWPFCEQNPPKKKKLEYCEENEKKIKVAHWSDMARNAIESDF